jgi:hypothetical protein
LQMLQRLPESCRGSGESRSSAAGNPGTSDIGIVWCKSCKACGLQRLLTGCAHRLVQLGGRRDRYEVQRDTVDNQKL